MSIGHIVHGQPMSKSIWTNMVTPKSSRNIFCPNGLCPDTPKVQWTKPNGHGLPKYAHILKISRVSNLVFGEKKSEITNSQLVSVYLSSLESRLASPPRLSISRAVSLRLVSPSLEQCLSASSLHLSSCVSPSRLSSPSLTLSLIRFRSLHLDSPLFAI